MALNDSIDALATGTYLVTRRLLGAWTDGLYTPGSASTFTISAVQEPATGLQRVVGGFELEHLSSGMRTEDIRVVYTRTELYTRSLTHEPDLITINNVQYTVFRVEPWDLSFYGSGNEIHYRALCSRITNGAA